MLLSLDEWLAGKYNKACAAAKIWGIDSWWEASTAHEVQVGRESGNVVF